MPEFVVPGLPSASPAPAPAPTVTPNTPVTLSTMRTQVRQRIGESVADFWSDSEIDGHLNAAQRKFAHEQRWRWLLTEVTGASISNVSPTLVLQPDVDFNRQFNLLLTRSGEPGPYAPQPKRVSPKEGYKLKAQMSFVTMPGRPLYYYLVAASVDPASQNVLYTVTFLPTPDTTYSIDYLFFREPPLMAEDTNVPIIPTAYSDALVSWAAAQCFLKELNGSGKAQEQFNLYNALLSDAIADEKSQAEDSLLILGGEEPQYEPRTLDLWARRMMPPTLGP